MSNFERLQELKAQIIEDLDSEDTLSQATVREWNELINEDYESEE